MERYGYLYGTVKEGEKSRYFCIGQASGVDQFLSDNGSTDNQITTSLIRSFLGDIPEYEGYFNQPSNEYPVAVRYAPMSLRSFPQMPNSIKPLYAMCINGFENVLGERAGKYTHLILTEQEGFYHSEGYSYLDRIFGTQLTSWQDVEAFKANLDWVPEDFCSAMPSRLTPEMDVRDQETVIKAVEGVFTRKTVILRLEKNCAFNRRAWDLLRQIFSLFTPQQAETFGFATYEKTDNISKLTEKTGIRIFVLPAEADISSLQLGNNLVIDLSANKVYESGDQPVNFRDLKRAIATWYATPWALRLQVMEAMFADVGVFDTEKYVQTTKDYVNDPFHASMRTGKNNGTCATLEELKALYDSFPLCRKIPEAHKKFGAVAQKLLKPPLKLTDLSAQALAQALYGKDVDERIKAEALYNFAKEIGGVSAVETAKKSGLLVRSQEKELYEAEIARCEALTDQVRKESQKALTEAKTERDNAVAAEQAKTAQVREEAQKALAKAKTECDNAVAAEQAKTAQAREDAQKALTEAKTERDNAVAAEQAKTAQAREDAQKVLAEAKTERDNAVAAEQAKTAQIQDAAGKALAEAREERDAAVEAEKKMAEQLKANAVKAITEERKKTAEANDLLTKEKENSTALYTQLTAALQQRDRLHAEKQNLEKSLQDADSKYAVLIQAKKAADQEAADAKLQTRSAKAEAANVFAEAERKIADFEQRTADAMMEADHAREELRRIKACGNYKPSRKQLLLSSLTGFSIALAICILILALVMMLNRPKTPETDPIESTPVATQEVTIPTETTVLPTEPTESPTEETESEKPVEEGYISGITGPHLMLEIPEIRSVVEENLDEWLPETAVLDGYEARAVFVLSDTEEENNIPDRYAVLYVPDTVNAEEADVQIEAENVEEETAAETVDELTKENEAESTEHTLPEKTEDASVDSFSEGEVQQELMVAEVEGAKMVLTSERYVLVLYGDEVDVATALQIFARIVPEEHQTTLRLHLQEETVDLNVLVGGLLGDKQWWRSVIRVSTNEQDLLEGQLLMNNDEDPFLLVVCEEVHVLLYKKIFSRDAENLAQTLKDAGYTALAEGKLVAAAIAER